MITPIKRDDKPSVFGTIDIENRANGETLAIGTATPFGYSVVHDWGKTLEHVRGSGLEVCYAHNGGGWDWLSLLRWCIDKQVMARVSVANRNIITLDLEGIEFRDSLRLLLCGLERAGQTLVGRGKVKAGALPEHLWKTNRRLFYKYLETDCLLLREVMDKFGELVRSLGSPGIRCTIAATSMAAWRRGLDEPIYCPEDKQLKDDLRAAYKGGRVQVFHPGEHKRVWIYDVNSMYPSVMSDTPMPIGSWRRTKTFDLEACSIYYIHYHQRTRDDLLPGVKGEGWFWSNELRRFKGKMECIRGWVCDETAILFRDYISTLWNLRVKHGKSSAIGYIAKIMANSLYGKFAQKGIATSLLISPTIEEIMFETERGNSVYQVDGLDAVMIEEPKEVAWENLGIAGTITSEARGRLYDGFGGNGTVLYCDTDSVHVSEYRGKGGDGLGEWSLVDGPVKACYAGPKLYALKSGEKETVKAKGAGRTGSNHLSYKDIKWLVEEAGHRKTVQFKSATTLLQMLRGVHPCKLHRRRRTLRMTTGLR